MFERNERDNFTVVGNYSFVINEMSRIRVLNIKLFLLGSTLPSILNFLAQIQI